ncbi:hypothetical protein IFT47_20510 [Pseudomonas sp. CFBP 13711]|uniref:hypothetical protein n=1 Tax=unclassified Pseudomonas TaxID=196821 RepID=UPI00177CDC22|nr:MULTISPECIES: hypothetical protein [unclassified Pseudomonas]MBD8709017.1 hypothetical protein [Pseudomonas sp. CFBP 13711]MBD8715058.1 hypothetical protein [Pseudomonas sp. CFBP 13715]
MIILSGFVQAVIIKNEDVQGKNPYAVVAIDDVSTDRDGISHTMTRKIMVAGNDYKKGLHNAYRTHIGAEVFAPVRVECELFNNKPQERYTLQGPPLHLVDRSAAPTVVKSVDQSKAG